MSFFFRRNNWGNVNLDAWSDGQTASKLWLSQNLENLQIENKLVTETLWIYGSWYGTLPQMLLTRERLGIKNILCFDSDPAANKIAKRMLDHWRIKGLKIEVYSQDCLKIGQHSEYYLNAPPDLVINTSCEHMHNYDWFRNLPKGVSFAAQSTDMVHQTHINRVQSIAELKKNFEPSNFLMEGELLFQYPTLRFTRFMTIGKKA